MDEYKYKSEKPIKLDREVVEVMNSINEKLYEIDRFKKDIEYYTEEKGYYVYYQVPIDSYLKLMNHAFSTYYKKKVITLRNSQKEIEDVDTENISNILIDSINKNFKIEKNINCSMRILIYLHKGFVYIGKDKFYIMNEKEEFIPSEFKKIGKKIKKITQNCDFCICSVSIYVDEYIGHRNAIFIEREPEDSLLLSWYEPHGSGRDDEIWYGFTKDFLYALRDYSGLKIAFKTSMGPPIGVQSMTGGYEVGYCSIFCYYWLYCCLSIAYYKFYIKKSKEYSFYWIGDVEQYTVLNKDPYKIAVSFCNFMLELFLTSLDKEERIKMNTIIQNSFNEVISEYKYIKSVPIGKPSLKKKKEKAESSWDEIPLTETMEYEEYKSKKKCEDNFDCTSDCCKDGVCGLEKDCAGVDKDVVM
jgi:hypothetical protein